MPSQMSTSTGVLSPINSGVARQCAGPEVLAGEDPIRCVCIGCVCFSLRSLRVARRSEEAPCHRGPSDDRRARPRARDAGGGGGRLAQHVPDHVRVPVASVRSAPCVELRPHRGCTGQELPRHGEGRGLPPPGPAVRPQNDAGRVPRVSEDSEVVGWAPPLNVEPPAIVGSGREAQPLEATLGTWEGNVTSREVRWHRCDDAGCLPLGATLQQYAPESGEVGTRLAVEVIATGPGGSTSALSNEVEILAMPPAVVVLPELQGVPREGETLSVSTGTWQWRVDRYEYQWQVCDAFGESCAPVPGATDAHWVPGFAEVGASIRVTVSAVGPGGATEALSPPTSPVQYGQPRIVTPPEISGVARERESLQASSGQWDGAVERFEFQWLTCDPSGTGCTALPEQRAETVTVDGAWAGRTLRVDVTAVGPGGATTSSSEITLRSSRRLPRTSRRLRSPASPGTASSSRPAPGPGPAPGPRTGSAGSGAMRRTRPARSWVTMLAIYRLVPADVGATLRVEVTAVSAAGDRHRLLRVDRGRGSSAASKRAVAFGRRRVEPGAGAPWRTRRLERDGAARVDVPVASLRRARRGLHAHPWRDRFEVRHRPLGRRTFAAAGGGGEQPRGRDRRQLAVFGRGAHGLRPCGAGGRAPRLLALRRGDRGDRSGCLGEWPRWNAVRGRLAGCARSAAGWRPRRELQRRERARGLRRPVRPSGQQPVHVRGVDPADHRRCVASADRGEGGEERHRRVGGLSARHQLEPRRVLPALAERQQRRIHVGSPEPLYARELVPRRLHLRRREHPDVRRRRARGDARFGHAGRGHLRAVHRGVLLRRRLLFVVRG